MIVFLLYLFILSAFDLREKTVPSVLLILGGILAGAGAGYGILAGNLSLHQPLLGMIEGVILLLIAHLTQKMGYADGIVLILIGLLTGYRGSLMVLCISSFLCAVFCMVLMIVRKINKNSRIPYIPFLSIAYFVYIFVVL